MRLINVLKTFVGTALEGNLRPQGTLNEWKKMTWTEEEFLETFWSHHRAGTDTLATVRTHCTPVPPDEDSIVPHHGRGRNTAAPRTKGGQRQNSAPSLRSRSPVLHLTEVWPAPAWTANAYPAEDENSYFPDRDCLAELDKRESLRLIIFCGHTEENIVQMCYPITKDKNIKLLCYFLLSVSLCCFSVSIFPLFLAGSFL